MIVGTAGHIDHGKTSLVHALTGVDTDRLKEEKARGITIDLGFAYLPIEGGDIIGFVDVPGHERFVHTMLAGAGGLDLALLTVAADDGVMPQTREHLAIVDLLGIDRGLVVLTKTDLVSGDRIVVAQAEIRQALAGTTLADAEIVPVSTVTGMGIAPLRSRLEEAARDGAPRASLDGAFRLAVDRVFTLAGIGLVVTGTILSGRVGVGDQVVVSPSGRSARVRSLHVQDRPAEKGQAGDRCALNLVGDGVEKGAIRRGDMVVAPFVHAPTDRIDAILRLLPGEPRAIGQWSPVRLHHGSAEVGARLVLLDDTPLLPGGTAEVQLVLERPIAAAAGDRYVLRDVSAQRTMGGGRFVDLRPPPRKRRTPERIAQRAALALADPVAGFAALLDAPPFAFDLTGFVRDRALTEARAAQIVAGLDLVVLPSGPAQIAMTPDRWRAYADTLLDVLGQFHDANPDMQGQGRERLRLSVRPRLEAVAFAAALHRLADEGRIILDGAFIRTPAHSVRFLPADESLWGAIAPLIADDRRFRPPRVRDIAGEIGTGETEVRRVLKIAARIGLVDEIAHDHFFLRRTTREMAGIAAELSAASPDGFIAAQFRDRMDNGRKVAIQILEHFDRHGLTVKRGDLRRINARRIGLFEPDAIDPGANQGIGCDGLSGPTGAFIAG